MGLRSHQDCTEPISIKCHQKQITTTSDKPYWLGDLPRQGTSPYHPHSSKYSIFRDVKDYGAIGDGIADDTAAINFAIRDGDRCGGGQPGSDSSTVSPALVYFPPGTYRISSPIISYYYTSLVGNATNLPVLKADKAFKGIALIDENPYMAWGKNWYTNQNNFFRSVAHFIIDMREVDGSTECAAIHHQVAQATGLRHVHFKLRRWSPTSGEIGQRGIFMENGSGGHLSDLTFQGGREAMWVGNQQFTVQRCCFEGCYTAISQHWNWAFMYSKIKINACQVGFRMRVGKIEDCAVASVICADWNITLTAVAFDIVGVEVPSKGSLVLSNVTTSLVPSIVRRSLQPWDTWKSLPQKEILLLSPDHEEVVTMTNWTWQGDSSSGSLLAPRTGSLLLPRPTEMIDAEGCLLHQSRPEYLSCASTDFLSLKDEGAKGDGITDDTTTFQAALDKAAAQGKVLYVPHGQYLLTTTVVLPPGCRIVGEVWPIFLGTGEFFSDEDDPHPVIQVGLYDGQAGHVEISECIFSTKGTCPGAIVVQWRLRGINNQTAAEVLAGMWDTHIRLGGFMGSGLDEERFDADHGLDIDNSSTCFLAFHLTPGASGCFVNNWVWQADHLLDTLAPKRQAGKQISLTGARGILIESNPGPVMLWGGASEHFVLYQYQLYKAKNVLIAHSQTESPYYLGEGCLLPQEIVKPQSRWHDPTWETTEIGKVQAFRCRSWGIRIIRSTSIHLLAAGLYSFFDSYKQDKLADRRCQEALLSIERCNAENGERCVVIIAGLNTVGTQSMIVADGQELIEEKQNRTGFCSTLGYYFYP